MRMRWLESLRHNGVYSLARESLAIRHLHGELRARSISLLAALLLWAPTTFLYGTNDFTPGTTVSHFWIQHSS